MTTGLYKKGMVLGIICLFIGAGIIPSISGTVEETVFDGNPLASGWKYKTPISLKTATPTDDHQVKIEIDSSDFDYSSTNHDGSDIRFYDIQGNKLSYWIEEWNPVGISVIWVKVLNAGTQTLYLYSGNNTAECESNGDETFIFFDDFEGIGYDWTEKWKKYFDPKVSVKNGELFLTDTTFDRGYLVSKQSISPGTRMKIKYKNIINDPGHDDSQWVGLAQDMGDRVVEDNCIRCEHQNRFKIWVFLVNRNKETSIFKNLDGFPIFSKYFISEFVWLKDEAKYYYNDELKHTFNNEDYDPDVIPDTDLSIVFESDYLHTLVCDWVFVTKYVEPERYTVIFSDDFNDDDKDLTKWKHKYTDGEWNETNHRCEFIVVESLDKHPSEGIESIPFEVSLSKNDSVIVVWNMTTAIDSSSRVGGVTCVVNDSTNWIRAEYARNQDVTKYGDSQLGHYQYMELNKKDGTWDNEIQIYQDRYIVRMDNTISILRYTSLFPSKTNLTVSIFTYNAGDTPGSVHHVSFDDVTVKVPVHGEQSPFIPRLEDGPEKIKPGRTYRFKFSVTDPDKDNVYLYINWENDTPGEWIGPIGSDTIISASHKWNNRGEIEIRLKALDVNCYESPWKEINTKVKYIHIQSINKPFFGLLFDRLLHRFPRLEQILGI